VAEAKRRTANENRARLAEQLKHERLFHAVAEEYIKRKVAGQRRAAVAMRVIRHELIRAWKDRPIGEVTRRDVIKLIEAINDRPAPIYAYMVFGHARTLFNWAIRRDVYGLQHSPCDRVKMADLVSRQKEPRQRVLTDDELRAFWRATGRMSYPWRELLRILLLTGTRRNEAAGARWCEFELEKKVWTIPPDRFKSKATHLVPLTDEVVSLLRSLPRYRRGDHLFSFSFGQRPVTILHRAKRQLDELMLRYLQAMARMRGEDTSKVGLKPWVLHDLRRVVRTRMAGLEINDTVAEMVIGHGRRGLQRVYDQHSYEAQMRRALELWGAELRSISAKGTNGMICKKRG
jgi:integrase